MDARGVKRSGGSESYNSSSEPAAAEPISPKRKRARTNHAASPTNNNHDTTPPRHTRRRRKFSAAALAVRAVRKAAFAARNQPAELWAQRRLVGHPAMTCMLSALAPAALMAARVTGMLPLGSEAQQQHNLLAGIPQDVFLGHVMPRLSTNDWAALGASCRLGMGLFLRMDCWQTRVVPWLTNMRPLLQRGDDGGAGFDMEEFRAWHMTYQPNTIVNVSDMRTAIVAGMLPAGTVYGISKAYGTFGLSRVLAGAHYERRPLRNKEDVTADSSDVVADLLTHRLQLPQIAAIAGLCGPIGDFLATTCIWAFKNLGVSYDHKSNFGTCYNEWSEAMQFPTIHGTRLPVAVAHLGGVDSHHIYLTVYADVNWPLAGQRDGTREALFGLRNQLVAELSRYGLQEAAGLLQSHTCVLTPQAPTQNTKFRVPIRGDAEYEASLLQSVRTVARTNRNVKNGHAWVLVPQMVLANHFLHIAREPTPHTTQARASVPYFSELSFHTNGRDGSEPRAPPTQFLGGLNREVLYDRLVETYCIPTLRGCTGQTDLL